MANELGKAYVQIIPSAKGISSGMATALQPGIGPASQKVSQGLAAGVSSGLKTAGAGMMKAGAIATAVSVPIIAGIKESLGAYQIQNLAETKLTEIYKTRMGATKQAANETMKLASALQKEGVIGDEVQLSGAQQLATFARYPSTVNTILPAMNNLLAQQKGVNATAEDATGIANLMGKAMMGQTGALRRVGISFDETQEKILKTGTEEERAAVLAQVVTDNVGNMNKKMAETPLGRIQQMENSFSDLSERIGGTLAPVLAKVADSISTNLMPKIEQGIKFLEQNPIIAKMVIGLTGLLAIGGPLIAMLGAVISGVGVIAGAVSGPVLAIGALAAVIAMAAIKSKPLQTALANLARSLLPPIKTLIATIIPVTTKIAGEIGKLAVEIANQLAPIIVQLTPIIKTVLNALSAVASTLLRALVPVIRVIANVIKALLPVIGIILSTVISVVSGVIKRVSKLQKTIKSAWNAIRSTTKTVWKAVLNFVTNPFKTIWNVLSGITKKIRNALKFSGISGAVKNVFSAVKNAITHPVDTAKNVIKGIIDRIKGFFHFSIAAPHIPLPHFSISPAGWKMKDLLKGKIPSLGIKWYAKGGIVDGATLVGAGEKGAEAIVPLDPFWKRLDKMQGQSITYNIGDITLDVKDLEDVSTLEDFVEVLRRAKAFA